MSQVFVDFGTIENFTLIESASIVMYCSVPSVPTKDLEDMCASVRNLANALSNGDSVSGTCTNSKTCLDVSCNLEMQVDFFDRTTCPLSHTSALYISLCHICEC